MPVPRLSQDSIFADQSTRFVTAGTSPSKVSFQIGGTKSFFDPKIPKGKMGLWTILEGFLLLANALAILNEDRFLAPRGWSFSEFSGGKAKSLKGQIIGLIYATQYLRVPLILLNSIFIVVKLVSG